MKNILYILLITLLFSSCTALKSVKKETKTVTSSEKQTTKKYDSLVSVKQNRAINDKYVFKVPKFSTNNKSKDSILDAKLNEILDKINFQKTSGNNSYKMSYNRKKRELTTAVEVGATEDKTKNVAKETKEVTKESSLINTISTKTGIPVKWIIGLMVFLLRNQIFWLLKKLFPVLETSKLIKYFK